MKWKCKDGRELELHEIETDHLKNIITWLRRQGVTTTDEFLDCLGASASVSGEFAQMALDNEAMSMTPWKDLELLEAELKKRKDK